MEIAQRSSVGDAKSSVHRRCIVGASTVHRREYFCGMVRHFFELRAAAAYQDVRILTSLTKEFVAAHEFFGVTLQLQNVDQSPEHRLHLVPVEQPKNDAATRSCDLTRDANHIVNERAELHLQQTTFLFATRRLPATGFRKTQC